MSIGSIQNLGPSIDGVSSSAETRVRPSQPVSSSELKAEEFPPHGADTARGKQNSGTEHAPVSPEQSQDEVQVLRDSQVQDQIVIKYLNQSSGDLIMQVPSAEVLNVYRGIHQELEQQAKSRDDAAAATVAQDGEELHGH
jgi:hypothetical protein